MYAIEVISVLSKKQENVAKELLCKSYVPCTEKLISYPLTFIKINEKLILFSFTFIKIVQNYL